MIPILEIKEKARTLGVPPSTIERDYAQNWLLVYLSEISMALKGGTGIRKVYFKDYRFSDDLDFTLIQHYDSEVLKGKIEQSIINAREDIGIAFKDDISFIPTRSGHRAVIYFSIIPSSRTSLIKIDLDLTEPENEEILLPVENKPIFHNYSDKIESNVTAYSLEEIMAEKIRSLFQRVRPRDLYDVSQIADFIDRSQVKSILEQKCRKKEVIIDSEIFRDRKERFRASWDTSLSHQMHALPDFEGAYNRVLQEIEYYKKLELITN